MNEFTLHLDVDPQLFYREDDTNINHIRTLFPRLKIIARNIKLIAFGEEHLLTDFQQQFEKLIAYAIKYDRLGHRAIDSVLSTSETGGAERESETDIIVHGINGKVIYPQAKNQVKLISLIHKNDMVLAIEPAGTGKIYVEVALAVEALKKRQVKRIILTHPAVEAGGNLGSLPGDLKEKLDPYMQPLYDALRGMIPREKFSAFIETGIIGIAPLIFIRGRTLDSAFVILDEVQNTTRAQMKMFLTRIGRDAKFMITGDPGQVNLPRKVSSRLKEAMLILQDVKGIAFLHLDDKDVVRHPLIRNIIDTCKTAENNQ